MPRRSRGEQGLDVLIRIERLEVFELFADADELDRQIELACDAEDGAALGRAVELGEDDAGTLNGLLELLGLDDGVLPAGGVEHEQDLVRGAGYAIFHDTVNLFQLAHQVKLRVQ